MQAMNEMDIARIAPERIARVVTERLVSVPTVPKLLALPVIMAAAATLFAGIAPWWMFAVPALVYLVPVFFGWRVEVAYKRNREALSLATWRGLYTVTAVPISFANGLMGGFFATLPVDQERTLWAFALCLLLGWTPSRGLHGPTFLLSSLSLLVPMNAVLVFQGGSRVELGLTAITFGFLIIINLFAFVERRQVRAQIARDLAAADLSLNLSQANHDVAIAEDTMRTVLDNMNDGALLYEGDGRWIYQNRAMARLHDMPDEVLKGLPTFADIIRHRALRGDYGPIDALPGGLEGWIASRVARFNTKGQAAERRRTVTGRDVEVTYRPLPGGRVLTVHRDLTDIVERERQLAVAQSESERTRSTMQSVLDNMGDGAALYAADGALLFHNAAFRHLLGFDLATLEQHRTLQDLGRFQLTRGDFGVDPDIEAEGVRRTAQIMRGDGKPFIRVGRGGQTLEVSSHRLVDGRLLVTYRDITELRQSEQTAARAREELSDAIEGLADGLAIFDANLKTIVSNPAFSSVVPDLGPDRLIGRTLPDILREMAHTGLAEGFNEANADKFVAFWESYVRNPKGYIEQRVPDGRWLRYHARRTALGHHVVGFTDISEIKRRELESKAAQERLADAIESIPSGFVLFDRDDHLIVANSRFREFYPTIADITKPGVTVREMLKVAAEREQFPLGGLSLDAWLEQRLAARLNPGAPIESHLSSGRWVQIAERRTTEGGLAGVYSDITDLKARESDTAAARDEAAQARERLLQAMEAMDDGIAFLDSEERLVLCNDAYRRFMNYIPEIVTLGVSMPEGLRHVAKMGAAPPKEDPLQWADNQIAALRAGRPALVAYGPQKWARGSMRYEADRRSVLLISDVSAERQRERELEKALVEAEALRDEAEAANQAKSTFLATMSHEIRTPMNGVLGMMEVLEAEGVADRQLRTVTTMRESAQALLRIIDDLLDFSKIEAGALDFEEAPFSLTGLVEGVVATFQPQAAGKSLSLVAAVAPGSTDALLGDPTRVRQILFNLLANALKFTERGGVMVRARTQPLGEGRTSVVLSVGDTGIGLSDAEKARLFQPFSQADSSTTRRYGGTGLGLSIVRRLAELMGGNVTVESAPGAGSTFTVMLVLQGAPFDSELIELPPLNAPAPQGTAAPGVVSGNRVLVVDDHPINREVLVRQLAALGVAADSADDGVNGLQAWRDGSYAVVFADIHMPRMDGFEMTAELRRIERAEKRGPTPVVAVTANAMAGEDERCRAAGMDGYLSKPVSLVRLRATVQRWLGPAAAARPAIDPAALDQWIDGDEVARRSLLEKFAQAAGESWRHIEALMASGDLVTLASAAHRLKGSALAVGAGAVATAAAALESAAKAGDRAGCQDGLGPLSFEIQRAQTEIG